MTRALFRTLSFEPSSTSAQTLAFFRGEGGDVDEADDALRLRRGSRDNRAAVGVADGEHGPRKLPEEAGEIGGVDRESPERIRRREDRCGPTLGSSSARCRTTELSGRSTVPGHSPLAVQRTLL